MKNNKYKETFKKGFKILLFDEPVAQSGKDTIFGLPLDK